MLRRQRTFFLSKNQYEPVVLVYLGINSGYPWFRFYHEDDATRYFYRYRTSNNQGRSWSVWVDSTERSISTEDHTDFYLNYIAGLAIQICVVMAGDEKDNSDPSNIVDAVIPAQPMQSPPVLDGDVYYVDGDAYAVINVSEFPTGVSRYASWRRAVGETEWMLNGIGISRFALDRTCENNTTYEYKAAWCDTDGNLLSYYSNIVTIAVPDAEITYLVPPIKFSADFFDYSGQGTAYDYWNRLIAYKGDMRSKGVKGQYKKNNGTWTDIAGDYNFEERGIDESTNNFIWWLGHSTRPTEGDVWQYRMKNYAEGYEDSEWSEIFEIVIPSLLPKLASPVVTLNQNGASVIIGWQEVENASGYRIERKLRTASEYTLIVDNLPASTRQYTDSGTWLENTYDIRVTALGDGQSYQNSNPTVESITISRVVVLEAPVIDSVTESGLGVVVDISNINTPNTGGVYLEMSENNGSWKRVAYGYPASQAVTTLTLSVDGADILEGGTLRFRAYCTPAGMAQENSPYSEIASITIDEREWLLRWTGTAWDYCTSVTGGWSSPTITFSDETVAGNVSAVDLGGGTLRLQGTGYFMTGAMTSGQNALSTTYKKICMVGDLIKQVDGTSNHAWFGSGHTYPFSGGTCIEQRSSYYTFAGSESGRAAAGTKTDPSVNPVARGTYSTSTGAHVFFRFYNGYADVKGIYAIKR